MIHGWRYGDVDSSSGPWVGCGSHPGPIGRVHLVLQSLWSSTSSSGPPVLRMIPSSRMVRGGGTLSSAIANPAALDNRNGSHVSWGKNLPSEKPCLQKKRNFLETRIHSGGCFRRRARNERLGPRATPLRRMFSTPLVLGGDTRILRGFPQLGRGTPPCGTRRSLRRPPNRSSRLRPPQALLHLLHQLLLQNWPTGDIL